MKDYSFGNFICALRMGRGLSQYQLGALVGVTDKAVSKWENGDSKPRLKTCQRLASVLGVTVNELLSCGNHKDVSARKDEKAMKELLWTRAHERLHELYGEVPAPECWGRLEAEQAVLKETNAIVGFDFLGKMMEKANAQNAMIVARGLIGSSFTAWLLGATDINPLRPHYYCPVCKSTEFHDEAEDGWDLPVKKCTCGAEMFRDGHNIPFEGYAHSLQKGDNFDVEIPCDFASEAEELLWNYYDELADIVPVEIQGMVEKPQDSLSVRRFVLCGWGEQTPTVDRDGMLRVTMQEYYNRFQANTRYALISSPDMQMLQSMAQIVGAVTEPNDFLDHKALRKVAEENCAELAGAWDAIEKTGESINFSLVARLKGLHHGAGIWEENGEVLLRNETANIRELIAYREDVWQMVLSRIAAGGSAGFGLPLKVMEDVRLGRYGMKGMDENVEQMLSQIGVPDWYITHMKQILYAFPKAHCISAVATELRLAWCQKRMEQR